MDPAKPSLDLLRTLTDEHVVRALMQVKRLTRAELAAATGISKPTVGESVRRLAEAGLVVDTGERTPGGRGRGRVGSYYALAHDIGAALAVSIAPEGVVAECVTVYGDVVARAELDIPRPAQPADVAAGLGTAAETARRAAEGPIRRATVSAADPVDRGTGRLIQLPDAPFLLGELSPVEVLGPHVDGPIIVDNDVNWAARAERDVAGAGEREDFAYIHLGEGVGCAIIADGEVLRGNTGIAGEIAHLVTVGPTGRATPFTEVFAELGLRRADSTAIDVPRLLSSVTGDDGHADATRATLGTAISGVLTAVVALADPKLIVLGGPWGCHPPVIETVSAAFDRLPRHVPVQAAQLTDEPSLMGARTHALHSLRSAIVAATHESPTR